MSSQIAKVRLLRKCPHCGEVGRFYVEDEKGVLQARKTVRIPRDIADAASARRPSGRSDPASWRR